MIVIINLKSKTPFVYFSTLTGPLDLSLVSWVMLFLSRTLDNTVGSTTTSSTTSSNGSTESDEPIEENGASGGAAAGGISVPKSSSHSMTDKDKGIHG